MSEHTKRIDELMRDHADRLGEAQGRAEKCRQRLIALAVDTDAESCDPDEIREAADGLAGAVQAMKSEELILAELRRLLF